MIKVGHKFGGGLASTGTGLSLTDASIHSLWFHLFLPIGTV